MFSRDRIARWLLVTLVTVVVWTWAASSTTDSERVSASIRVSLPDSLRDQRELLSPADPFATKVTIRGSEGERRDAKDLLAQVRLTAGQGGVPDGLSDNAPFDLQDVLQEYLRSAGAVVQVTEVETAAVPLIRVEELVATTVQIVPVLPGVRVDGEPVVAPNEATVRLSKRLLERAGRLRVEATLDSELLAGRETGRRYTEKTALRVAPENPVDLGTRARIEPQTADITFTLAARTTIYVAAPVTSTAPGIPVQIALPPKDLDKWSVAIDDRDAFVRNVTLSGPTEAIEQIRDGRFKVRAFVQLTSDDLDRAALDKGMIEKPISLWQLPPEVRVVDPGKTDYQLEQDRDSALPRRGGVLVRVKARTPGP